jgi:inosose dehydratase
MSDRQMHRRQLLMGLAAAAVRAQTLGAQTFRAGLVPAGPGKQAGAASSRDSAATYWSNCDEASALGFHFIEFNNTRAEIVEAYTSRIAEFKDEMFKRHLTLAGVALFSHAAQSSKRAELIEHHMRLGRFLAAVGGEYITHMIAPGEVLNEPADESEYNGVDVKTWAANANEIGKRLLNEHGVKLAYHPERGEIRSRLHENILDATDERYFRLLVDTGHVASGGASPLELCKRYRSRLECVHLKDVSPAAGLPAKAGNAPFGEGAVDLPAVVAALRDLKFNGWVMSESGGTNQGMRDYMVRNLKLAL